MNMTAREMQFVPDTGEHRLLGLAALMQRAFDGEDLTPLGQQLIECAGAAPSQACANALLDLSIVLQLKGNPELALVIQQRALQISQLYRLPASRQPALRLLALMGPGDLIANTPLEFLVEDSDIELTLLYVAPNLPFPEWLPEHDVLFVAVCESDERAALLTLLSRLVPVWPRPILNLPEHIVRVSREESSRLLQGLPGVVMPLTSRVRRARIELVGRRVKPVSTMVQAETYPIIIRPRDSHAGRGLIKACSAEDILDYLQATPDAEFQVAPFVDYRSADGLFRKYRVVLIDGRPYASHMAISGHWMIHYLNGGMSESADKRAEEERFMREFEQDFALRHAVALAGIHERMGLDYLVIDCAETRDGKLLVFEVDSGAVVHDMDPPALFPYKRPQMQKVFAAFRAMLFKAAGLAAAVN